MAEIESPIGSIWVAADDHCITLVSFEPLDAPARAGSPLLTEAKRQIAAYFNDARHVFDVPLSNTGTDFQRSVWERIRGIASGSTLSYQAIADGFAGDGSARAVGAATGANPWPLIVPCHRVVSSAGGLTGYLGGLRRKRWLLQHEGALPHDLFAHA